MRCRPLLAAWFTVLSGACLPGYTTTVGATDGTEGAGTTDVASTSGAPTTEAPTTGAPTATDPGSSTTAADGCGDGEIGAGEVCDGLLLGGKSCADVDPRFDGGVLACADDCASFDTSKCTGGAAAVRVVLNEVTSKAVAEGEYADKGAAIELYNDGVDPVDLAGWQLSDDAAFPPGATYVFAPGTTLMPGAFLVLVSDGELPFALDGESETLTLADARGATQDAVTFAVEAAAQSYCRVPDGDGAWEACEQTFGASNVAATPEACGDGILQAGESCDGAELGGASCASLGLGRGALACTAVCTFDTSQCVAMPMLAVVVNELESTDDQIELYNAGDAPVDLSGWILTDDAIDGNYDPMADAEKLVFPAMTVIAAKQFLVVAKGMNPGEHPFGLGGGGDGVSLAKPDLTVVDQVTYGADEAAVSYCRLPDGPGGAWTVGCQPTFGAANKGP